MRQAGKLMQILGLILLPMAMLFELTRILGPSFGVRDMLLMLVFGGTLFYLGRFLEGYRQQT